MNRERDNDREVITYIIRIDLAVLVDALRIVRPAWHVVEAIAGERDYDGSLTNYGYDP